MKMKYMAICFLLVTVTLLGGCGKKNVATVKAPPVSGKFEFTVLKAGQADSMLIETQNNTIILDCGEEDDGDKIVELLQNKGISNVDYIFITHYDKDHVGGFPEVMENITANSIIVPSYEGNNKEYEKYLETINEKNLTVTFFEDDTSLIIDDVMFEISVPKKKAYAEGDNDFSLVISATHGENTFLFAGDAEKDRLTEVIREFGRKYDFLKVPHHGKYNKNTKRFINTVKPSYAVICDSEKHPAEKETVSLLESAKCKIYSTKDGDVTVSSDGKEIRISQ